jgi:hypothetical protein
MVGCGGLMGWDPMEYRPETYILIILVYILVCTVRPEYTVYCILGVYREVYKSK